MSSILLNIQDAIVSLDKAEAAIKSSEIKRVITCETCFHWEEPVPGARRKHGVCHGTMANAKTFDRLRTLPEFGCIYHNPK